MPVNTLLTGSVVKVKENVLQYIRNYGPDDSPILSMIEDDTVDNTYTEWQRDTYRAPDGTRAAIEGADAVYPVQTQPTLLNNRTQIFQEPISVSNTAQRVKKYGREDEIKRLKLKKMIELKRDKEAAYLSSPVTVAGTVSVPGRTRGLYGFLTQGTLGVGGVAPDPTTNTAPVNGTDRALTEQMLKDGVQSCYTNGGSGSIVTCSPAHKVKISTFTGNVQRTNEVGTKKAAVLNTAFDFYRTDFGVTQILPNRVQVQPVVGLNDTLYIIDADKLADGCLRSMESQEMAITGDARQIQVRTECMLIVRDEKPMYAIRDITVSGS